MANFNSIGLDVGVLSTGYEIAGGTSTKRKLTLNGSGDMTFTGAASAYTYTMPGATTTLVGHDTAQTLTNKTVQGSTSFGALRFATSTTSSPSDGDLWYQSGYLNWRDSVGTKKLGKRTCYTVLMAAHTPAGTGGDDVEFTLPHMPDGTSITWVIKYLYFALGTTSSSGNPAIKIEKSNPSTSQAFSAGTVTTMTASTDPAITAGNLRGAFTTFSSTGANTEAASGLVVRVNVTATGTGTANWFVGVLFEEK